MEYENLKVGYYAQVRAHGRNICGRVMSVSDDRLILDTSSTYQSSSVILPRKCIEEVMDYIERREE